MQLILTPELVMEAYRQGLFPMAYNSGSPTIHWICPEKRGQLSIEHIHIAHSLKKALRKHPFEIRINNDFDAVIRACAEPTETRPETWINTQILNVFCELHRRGHAHSIECWKNDTLVGGLYGLAIGGAFFGESMFSRATNASKIALIHTIARLWKGGFTLFDTQFVNEHLKQFDVYELLHLDYKTQLDQALKIKASFFPDMPQGQILDEYLAMRGNN